jgi:excisionase family DNA binding protein
MERSRSVPVTEPDQRHRMEGTASLRVTLTHAEAAAALGVSRDFFDEHLLRDIPHIRRGRRRLFPLAQLERWAEEASARWSD